MIIPTFYAVDLGLGLGLVGSLFAMGRVFDIISDPVIGILSDKTRSRLGARKPWMIVGLPLFCFAAFLLLTPPDDVTASYLLLVSCLYFLSFTVSEIPQAAMGLEVSTNKHERTVLAASKTLFLILGGIIGAAAPLIWTETTSQALSKVVVMIFVATLFVLPLHIWLMPNHSQSRAEPTHGFKDVLYVLKSNGEIRKIIGTFFILITSKSFGAALSLLYISYVLQMPELVGLFWIASGIGMLCGLPLWILFSRRVGKLRSWRISTIIGIVAYLALLFLGAGDKVPMITISVILGLSGVADSILSVSLLADQIGIERDKGRPGSAGLVTAVKNATSKLSIAIPMLTAFPILGFIGLTEGSSRIGIVEGTAEFSDRLILISLYAGIPLLLKVSAFFAIGRLGVADRMA